MTSPMKRWMKWLIAALVLLVLAGAVLRSLQARKLARNSVATSPQASAALDLAPGDVLTLQNTTITRTLALSGSLKAVSSAFIKAKVAAEVKSLTVREGDRVRAGQVIGQLDNTELALRLRQAEQNAATSRAQLDIAKRTLDNNRALVAQGFISPTGLQTSISNEAAAQATYSAAQAAVELARKAQADAQLVAPISGVVSQRLVQPGERVGIDTRLVEVVDLSRIELEAALTPEDVGAVQVGQVVLLQVDGIPTPVRGRVARINPSTQAGTRAVMVYVAIDTPNGLRQGLFAKGSIELAREQVLAAPLSAVRVDQARPYVLAVQGGQVAQRTVSLGRRGEAEWAGQRESVVELLDGAPAGTVVLRGSVGALRDGTAVRLAASAPAAPSAPVAASPAASR
jgi:membrane fusion protein, multidrug efflux system